MNDDQRTMIKTDLHMHSSFSDGLLAPEELLCRIINEGIHYFSLTDHDCIAGNAVMKRLCTGYDSLHYIEGAELSAGENGRIHLLVYGNLQGLGEHCEKVARLRRERAARIAEKLSQAGYALPEEALQALLQGQPSRLDIARELCRAGYFATPKAAIQHLLIEGKAGYVPLCLPKVSELLYNLKGQSLLTVLAHPMKIGCYGMTEAFALMESLIPLGLSGVECYHPSCNARQAKMLADFAREKKLLVTGGSDFHGDGKNALGKTGSLWVKMEQDTLSFFEKYELMKVSSSQFETR